MIEKQQTSPHGTNRGTDIGKIAGGVESRVGGVLSHSSESTSQYPDISGIDYQMEYFSQHNNIYPQNHPIALYVNTLFHKLESARGLPDIIVFDSMRGQIDAHIIKNGQIYISRDLLGLCDYEEEIQAVMSHEIRHFKNNDFEEQQTGADIQMARELGISLIQEWSADIDGLIDLDSSGINPYGAAIFFRKLSKLQKQGTNDDFSNSHGSTTDRSLNVLASTRLYDFEHLSDTSLTPIDRSLLDAHTATYVNQGGQGYAPYMLHQKVPADQAHIYAHKIDAIKGMTLFQSVAHLRYAYRDFEKAKQRCLEFDNSGNKIHRDNKKQIVKIILGNIEDSVFNDDDIPDGLKAKIYHLTLLAEARWVYFSNADEFDLDGDLSDSLDSDDALLDPELVRVFRAFTQKYRLPTMKHIDSCADGLIQMHIRRGCFEDDDAGLSYPQIAYYIGMYVQLIDSLTGRQDSLRAVLERVSYRLQEEFPGESNTIQQYLKQEFHYPQGPDSKNIENHHPTISHDAIIRNLINQGNTEEAIERLSEMTHIPLEDQVALALQIKDAIPLTDGTLQYTLYDKVVHNLIGKLPTESYSDVKQLATYIVQLSFDDEDTIDLLKWGSYFVFLPDASDFHYKSPEQLFEVYDILFSGNNLAHLGWDRSKIMPHFSYGVYMLAHDILKHDTGTTSIDAVLSLFKEARRIGIRHMNKIDAESDDMENSYVYDESGRRDDREFKSEYFESKQALVFQYLKRIKTLPPEKRNEHLLELSLFIDDIGSRRLIQKQIAERIIQDMDFDDGFELIFNRDLGSDIIEQFIEKKAKTHDQIKRCKAQVLKMARLEGVEQKVTQGYHLLHHLLTGRDKLQLLRLALSSRESDYELKKYLRSKKDDLGYIAEKFSLDEDELCDTLYLLSDMEKVVFLREVLIGKRGILHSSTHRHELLKYFSQYHLQNANGIIEKELMNLLETFMNQDDVEDMYFIFSSILFDRIFVPPTAMAPSGPEVAGKVADGLGDSDRVDDLASHGRHESTSQYTEGGDRTALVDSIKELFPDASYIPESKNTMDAAELVIQIAKHLGSIGIRFLQVMGQYVSIPDELKPAFSEVYDGIQGQSKLVAHTTLSKSYPRFSGEVAEIGGMLGGGSIATVYKVLKNSGEERVVKIINPSFSFHYEKMFATLTKIFEEIAKSDARYKTAISMLADIREWIALDSSYSGFIQKDERFHKKWNGWKHDKKSRYSIMVPKTFGPESLKYKEEEYVHGNNLTQIQKLQEQGHDIQEIVRLLIAHYIEQIRDGQIHSDVHAGNFRITEDNRVAILDRSFYLELGWREKLFIRSLIQDIKKPEKLMETFVGFLSGLPENSGKDISSNLAQFTDTQSPVNAVFSILTQLRSDGVYIPLWITLFVKNINALYDLAKTHGVDMSDI